MATICTRCKDTGRVPRPRSELDLSSSYETIPCPEAVHSQPKSLDITGADAVEVRIRADGKVLWVNTPQGCVLRICRIDGDVVIQDERPNGPESYEWVPAPDEAAQ